MSKRSRTKICLVASSGGHLTQLMRLHEAWQDYEVCLITTKNMVLNSLMHLDKVYVVGECNRQTPFRLFKVMGRSIRIAFIERPRAVISTGAAIGVFLCYWGKLLGAHIIWIDSIANIQRLSLSGRLVRPISDICLTQWPEVAAQYKNVNYVGAVM